MRGDSLAGLSSGFTLGHEVRGQEVNGDSFTADVLYNISEECINCRSLAWEFGQRPSARKLRRSWREVALKFPWSDKGAGAAGDRAWQLCLFLLLAPEWGRASRRTSVHTQIQLQRN